MCDALTMFRASAKTCIKPHENVIKCTYVVLALLGSCSSLSGGKLIPDTHLQGICAAPELASFLLI